MPPISVLMKPASSMCNMTCDYCFYCDEAKKRELESFGFMSETTLKNVIRKTLIPAEGSATYAFQGGEPTLRGLDFFKKVLEYQKQYNKNHIQIHNALQTNGYAIDEEWCEFLHDNNFLVGISVDGTEEIHDCYRHSKSGKPTYERVVKTTELFDKYKVEYNILTVVNKKVAASITEIYQEYKKRGWMYQQYITCLDPLNEEHGNSEYALLPEQYGKFLMELFDLWYEDLLKGKQPFIRQFDNYVAIAKGYPPEACNQRGICGIQNVVEADGSVYPCDFYVLDDYKIGNFNEERLHAINERRVESGFLQRSLQLDARCVECRYYTLCRGECQRNRDYNQETQTYSNYFCEGYKMFFEHIWDRVHEVAGNIR